MGEVFKEDIKSIVKAEFIPWEKLENRTILITGATGLIGSEIVNILAYMNAIRNLNISIVLVVRDKRKAKEKFKEIRKKDILKYIEGSMENFPEIPGNVDYIIHGASQTQSIEFVNHPIETIDIAIKGTSALLNLAREKKVKSFIYLSSMEVYGYPEKGHKVAENEIGAFTPLNLRNSYPISKIMCETMCCAFEKEYGVPAKIVRLTQTFGAGVKYNDARIFAYFGRCVKEKKNIVLKTKGETERSYLYTTDAVTAILTILLKGMPGMAYNAADEKTYCSIAEMAEMVAEEENINVIYEIQDSASNGYADTLYMNLDTSRLKDLGWKSIMNLNITGMFKRMVDEMLN